ncbi:MAG TPA: hypothetical protein VGH28_19795 [Polyangiaceae bacterium]|jgi:hypothetical protein
MKKARICAALFALSVGCGGAQPVATRPNAPAATPKGMRVVREPGRPALAIVAREGDPTPAVGAFVSTAGIAPDRGAVVPVALAGLFASRLDARARVTPQADGVRLAIAGGNLAELAAALTAPVGSGTDLGLAQRKVAALAAMPRVTPEEATIAACEGALVESGGTVQATEIESWRAAAVTRERVSFAVVGSAAGGTAQTSAVGSGSVGAPVLPSDQRAAPEADAPGLAVYEAPGLARGARVAIAWRGDARLASAARSLGDPSGPFAAMLAASDTRAHLRSVTATLSTDGACLSLRADVDTDPKTSAGAARIAELVAMATREARLAATGPVELAADPSDAAEQAALVAAETRARDLEPPRTVVAVAEPGTARDAIATATVAARRAFAERVVEPRVRVERGQPALWMLVASPCGTQGETDGDAGASAAFAIAAATALRARGIAAEPWTASDGVGVIASGDASALGRVFLTDAVEGTRAAQARLLDAARPGLSELAEAIAPGRPASILPTGTARSLLRLAPAAIAARADALRRGPLRVAVLANEDAAQGDAAVAAIDRWALREGARACPARAEGATPKPGTYAVQTDDGTSEAYLAAPLGQEDDGAAETLADALDGENGLLAKALGDGLARAWSARVLGRAGSRALVVHVDAPQEALDAAVAQVRALFDRLRQGALDAADVARSKKREADALAARMRDPRERLIALFRGEPAQADVTLERGRAAAAAILRDDALVIVAARPARAVAAPAKKAP